MNLLENVVINPKDVALFCEKFAEQVEAIEAKQWFRKKLRVAIINDAALLRFVRIEDGLPVPDYVRDAAERGEDIYEFGRNHTGVFALEERMNHIRDWFNALHDVATRDPEPGNPVSVEDQTLARRHLAKLMRYEVKDITAVADEWFRHMGTRVGAAKKGVEVVMRWPDGFYAVRYTDRETMMRDGVELQNCLQHGTYWRQVASGENTVYGIRRPNDEAVVGIRTATVSRVPRGWHVVGDGEGTDPGPKVLAGPRLEECKGKNNKPVVMGYRRYVVDFLNSLHLTEANQHDLEGASLTFSKGRVGAFEDIAEVIHDANGLKVWEAGGKIIARRGNSTAIGTLGNVIAFDDHDLPASDLCAIVNALGVPPAPTTAMMLLRNYGHVYANGRCAPLSEIGRVIQQEGENVFYDLPNGDGSGRVLVEIGDARGGGVSNVYRYDEDEISYATDDIRVHVQDRVGLLNTIGRAPSFDLEARLAVTGVFYDGSKYGSLDKTAVKDRTLPGCWRLGTRQRWVFTPPDWHGEGQRPYLLCALRGKTLMHLTPENVRLSYTRDDTAPFAPAIRAFVKAKRVGKITSAVFEPGAFDILKMPNGKLATDVEDFVRLVADDRDTVAFSEDPSIYGRFLSRWDMTTAEQRMVYDALRPQSDADYARFEASRATRIVNHDVTLYRIVIPILNPWLMRRGVFTDPSVRESVERDMAKTIQRTVDFIDAHLFARWEYATTYVAPTYAMKPVKDAIDRSREVTNRELESKVNQAVKSEDVSTLFAAMNAMRKMRKL